MEKLLDAITDLVSSTQPDKITELADCVRNLAGPNATEGLKTWAQTPAANDRLTRMIRCWNDFAITPPELAGMLLGASHAYNSANAEQDIELVWTGPSSGLVATRKTEQALLQVINAASSRLFLTSFVAYDVASIMSALRKAIDRGVAVSMLLESSDKHGGGVGVDAIGQMRAALPTARIYFWGDKGESFAGGKVHAKVAVCDGAICLISSANLTGHAMEKNIEAGVLIRGGSLPIQLENHLEALVTVKILNS